MPLMITSIGMLLYEEANKQSVMTLVTSASICIEWEVLEIVSSSNYPSVSRYKTDLKDSSIKVVVSRQWAFSGSYTLLVNH